MPGAGRSAWLPLEDDQPVNSQRSCDVTAVITFHREELVAHKALLSLKRCLESARAKGIRVEVVASLDRSNQETARVVSSHLETGTIDQLLWLDHGDLGSCRNDAVQAASGDRVLICDGDDYLSADFIVRCMETASGQSADTIVHPELIVTFEDETNFWWQRGSDRVEFDPCCMLVMNPWNACSFASRDVYLRTPYVRARPGETGFGFEDWHWNCETLAAGCKHVVAPRTVHYVRKKRSGSLNNAHTHMNALIPPTRLFDPR